MLQRDCIRTRAIRESPGEAALTGSKGKKIFKADCEAKDKDKKRKERNNGFGLSGLRA